MKKLVLGLSLALASLGLVASPAMAVPDSPRVAPMLSVADQAFLATLARTPAPIAAAKRPIPGQKALCSATAACDVGSVSCSGNNSSTSCTAVDRNCAVGEPGHVTCDGVTTTCSNPCPPPACDCAALQDDCQWNCDPCPFVFTCDDTTCASTCRCRLRFCNYYP